MLLAVGCRATTNLNGLIPEAVCRAARNVVVWFTINERAYPLARRDPLNVAALFACIASEASFLIQFACGIFFSFCLNLCVLLPLHDDGAHHIGFLKPFLALVGAPVFEGEFRDGGLVQFAFAECDQSLVLIVGRLS